VRSSVLWCLRCVSLDPQRARGPRAGVGERLFDFSRVFITNGPY